MHRLILPPPVKIITKFAHDVEREFTLFADVERLVQDRVIHLCRIFADGGDQGDKLRLMEIKNVLDLCRCDAAFIAVGAYTVDEHHGVTVQALMKKDEVLEHARKARDAGSTRFCMGAAWREVRDNHDFDRVLEMVE